MNPNLSVARTIACAESDKISVNRHAIGEELGSNQKLNSKKI